MTTLATIDLETGDLTQFDSSSTNGGQLSVSAGAALHGSYGLQCVITTTSKSAYKTISKAAAGFRVRIYFDPNSITMADGDQFTIFGLYQSSGSVIITRLDLKYVSGTGYQIICRANNDANTSILYDTENITDAVHYIEIKGLRATNDASGDGAYEWWIDGVSKGSSSSVDNYNRINDYDWNFYALFTGGDAGTSGTVYLDDMVITDTPNTEIGAISGSSFKAAWARNANVMIGA